MKQSRANVNYRKELNFPDLFKSNRDVTLNQLQKSETEFKAFFGPVLTEYIAVTKKITDEREKTEEAAKETLN